MDHLAGSLTYWHDLMEIGVLDSKIGFSWVISLFDLMIFSEIMTNETDFIDYLNQRMPLYEKKELIVLDEIDFLGYYLENDLVFNDPDFKDVNMHNLIGFKSVIDDYFNSKLMGEPVEKPRKVRKVTS